VHNYNRELEAPQGQLSREKTWPIDDCPLEGSLRREFEKAVVGRPDIKRTRQLFVRILLDEFCRGRADCFPSNAKMAEKAGCTSRNARGILTDLDIEANVLRLVSDRSITPQRRIVFVDHPHAEHVFQVLSKSPAVVALNPDIDLTRGGARRRAPRMEEIDTPGCTEIDAPREEEKYAPREEEIGAPREEARFPRNVAFKAQHLRSATGTDIDSEIIAPENDLVVVNGDPLDSQGKTFKERLIAEAKKAALERAARTAREIASPPKGKTPARKRATPKYADDLGSPNESEGGSGPAAGAVVEATTLRASAAIVESTVGNEVGSPAGSAEHPSGALACDMTRPQAPVDSRVEHTPENTMAAAALAATVSVDDLAKQASMKPAGPLRKACESCDNARTMLESEYPGYQAWARQHLANCPYR
jgi:hypothetical protein